MKLVTSAQMRALEGAAIAGGVASAQLMEEAGERVAELVCAHCKPDAKVVVYCGPGNNGGDGFVAARVLTEYLAEVHVV